MSFTSMEKVYQKKVCILTVGLLSLGGSFLPLKEVKMERIKVGIVGLGDGGKSNLKSLEGVPRAEVVALCDSNLEVLKKAHSETKKKFRTFARAENLVLDPEVELVVVATPDHLHLEVAKAALEAGKYVFVEKPLATTPADLAVFKKLAGEYHGKLLFSEKYSFAYPVQETLENIKELGGFMGGSTFYTMWNCDRIMGGGKWRTETAYNPCAGGLSHNFMVALLFARSPIIRAKATGRVTTYHENLDKCGGYDTMEGVLEFSSGKFLHWFICLATRDKESSFGHRFAYRTVTHNFQFLNGILVYGAMPWKDRLMVGEREEYFQREPDEKEWPEYNLAILYRGMHENLLRAFLGEKPLHDIHHGINVAAACALAFESAKKDGVWLEIPKEFQF